MQDPGVTGELGLGVGASPGESLAKPRKEGLDKGSGTDPGK